MGILAKTRTTLSNYRELILEPPSPSRIKRVLIAVNAHCNSKCTFCGIWKHDRAQALKEEWTLDELESHLLGSAALQGVWDIGLTGGEPFLRQDLAAVCRSLYRHMPRAGIGLVTNGLLPERISETAAEIARSNPGRALSVAVSLDGLEETHDRVRGVPGNFSRALKTVEALKSRAPGVEVGFSHTVTPTNGQDSLGCYELARKMGVGFFYRLAHESPYLGNMGARIWSPESLQAVKPLVSELNRRLLRDQSARARLANLHYASIAFNAGAIDYAQEPRRSFDCFSGTHSFFMAHTGDIFPCIFLTQSPGNIRQTRFDEMWLSPRAAEIRRSIAAWKCHCWTNCETELSLARRKSVFLSGMRDNTLSFIPNGREAPRV